jgi:hypothetical protein
MPIKKLKINPNKIVVCSHNINSNALKNLAAKLSDKLGYRVYRVTPERVRGRRAVVFHPGVDKIHQLQAFKAAGASVPDFSTNYNSVKEDIPNAKQIVCRALTNSSEGRGISIVARDGNIPRVPLYTAYIPKKKEFRVHVFDNEVIDVAEKRKRKDGNEDKDHQVRNTANGYVFCRQDVVEPAELRPLAVAAVKAINRTQGAVDIIWNEKQNKCYVLEVNSRPGMEGTTVEKYANAVIRRYQRAV